MQKRILWGAAALVLLLVFAGCSQPTDFTYSGASPGNPGALKADVTYDGLVLLTWTPVVNAKEYEVWRYDTVTKVTKSLAAGTSALGRDEFYYRDFVARDNQLVDGRNYEYTVVAINNSFNASGMPLKNGSSKTSAKPKIPAEGSPVTANVDVEIEVGGTVLVTFTNQPNLDYSVSYSFGSGEFVWTSTGVAVDQVGGADTAGGWLFEPKRYITFPAVGGDNTLSVNYSFAGGGWLGGGTAKTETVSYELDFGLGAVTNFIINRTPTYAILEWDPVPGASGYEVYKALVSGNPTFSSGAATKSINFFGDWVPVDITPPELDKNTSDAKFKARELLESNTGNYVYAIKAVGGGFTFGYATPFQFDRPNISARLRDDESTAVELRWNYTEGATYKLERAVIEAVVQGTEITLDDYVMTDGIYEEITFNEDRYVLGYAVVIDRPEVGFSYIYKLTTTEFGYTSTPSFAIMKEGVFNKETSFRLSQVTEEYEGNPGIVIANRAINIIVLEIKYTGVTDAEKDRPIDLYRRKAVLAGISEDAYPWVKQGDTKAYTVGTGSIYIENEVENPGWKYDYKIVVEPNAANVGVFNKDTSNGGDGGFLPAAKVHGWGWKLSDATELDSDGNVIVNATASNDVNLAGYIGFDVPAGAVLLGQGSFTPDDTSTNNANEFANSGWNIEGLTLKVEFAIRVNDGASNYTGSVVRPVTVRKATRDGSGSTKEYLYYFTLPRTTSDGSAIDDAQFTDWDAGDATSTDPDANPDFGIKAIEYPWDAFEGTPNDSDDPADWDDILWFELS